MATGDQLTQANVPAAEEGRPVLTNAVDLAALLSTIALLVTVAVGIQGAVRILLALAFVTLVPGWAILGGLAVQDCIRRMVLAVPVSLALCAAAATISLWLHAWRPMVLFGVLALGSMALIAWRLARPVWQVIGRSGVLGRIGPAYVELTNRPNARRVRRWLAPERAERPLPKLEEPSARPCSDTDDGNNA